MPLDRVPFIEKLIAAASQADSWLCVGLDPDPAEAPRSVVSDDPLKWIVDFNRGIVEATGDLVCCYKPNLAFYEVYGARGWEALQETIRLIPSHIPVIADAKRGDIGNTARKYAETLFDTVGVDAATVSPYLGADSLQPFFSFRDRGVFVLCHTSNPGAADLQELQVVGPSGEHEPLYVSLARQAQTWAGNGTLGLVVGATFPRELQAVRSVAPKTPILVPGVGAQAGDLEAAVRAGVDRHGERALVNVSRGVLYASKEADWQEAARVRAEHFRSAINAARAGVQAT